MRDATRKLEGVQLDATSKKSYSARRKQFKRKQHRETRARAQNLEESVRGLTTEVTALKTAAATPAAALAMALAFVSAPTPAQPQSTSRLVETTTQGSEQAMDLSDAKD